MDAKLPINAEPNQKMQCLFKDDKKKIGTLVIHTIEVEIQQMVRHEQIRLQNSQFFPQNQ